MRRPTPDQLARYVETFDRSGKPVRAARVTADGEIVLEFGQADERKSAVDEWFKDAG